MHVGAVDREPGRRAQRHERLPKLVVGQRAQAASADCSAQSTTCRERRHLVSVIWPTAFRHICAAACANE
jgi:hypothetical protein